jgi:DNA invertase Pin-like site-specific DNA recombinase
MPSLSIAAPETMPVSADDLLLDLLGRLPDPRARRGRRRTVSALVAVAVCAVLTGAKGFTAMAEWARDAGTKRLGKLGMSRAVADESTFRRVFARLDVEVLDRLLGTWAMTRAAVVDGRTVFAIDGKSIRGARKKGAATSFLVAAFDHATGMVAAQVGIGGKDSEITAARTLLDLLDLAGGRDYGRTAHPARDRDQDPRCRRALLAHRQSEPEDAVPAAQSPAVEVFQKRSLSEHAQTITTPNRATLGRVFGNPFINLYARPTFSNTFSERMGCLMALVGLVRVSTKAQETARQHAVLDPICVKVFEEKISGKLRTEDRPGLVKALGYLRRDDMLTVHEVDRLGRNLLEGLIVLNDLFQRGIAVKVLDGIAAGEHTERSLILDLALALAEDRRRDIVRKTKSGLDTARASGRVGGRPTVVDDDKRRTILARRAEGQSLRTIAAGTKVSLAVVHGVVTAAAVLDTVAADEAEPGAAPEKAVPQRLACPGCGTVPNGKIAAARLREELQTEWWSTTGTDPARIEVTRHCGRCQPHAVYALACLACGDGPLLTGQLAEVARDTEPQELPAVVISQLTAAGWQWATTTYGAGWICHQHGGAPAAGRVGVRG